MSFTFHIIGIIVIYLSFPIGFFMIKERLKRGGNLMGLIFAPIMVSFFLGAGALVFAVATM